MRVRQWDVEGFVKDWNGGVSVGQLRKKYLMRQPAQAAHKLRQRGRSVVKRYIGWQAREAEAQRLGCREARTDLRGSP